MSGSGLTVLWSRPHSYSEEGAGVTPMLLIRLEVDISTGCEIQALGNLPDNLFLSHRN